MAAPFTDIKSVEKVLGFRKANPPIPFRDIAERMEKDVKTIHRWYKKGTGQQKMSVKM